MDDIKDLLIAHDVVLELMQHSSRSSWNQSFQVVLNAISAKVVEIAKTHQKNE